MILLYPETETQFNTNGLGALSDSISCEVTEERNGAYEMQMEYPITGIHYNDIQNRDIIFVKPTPYKDPQPFRIYRITKPLSGRVTIYAEHLSYDLSGIVVSPFSAESLNGALNGLKSNSSTDNPFEFVTDKNITGQFNVSVPSSIRSLLGGNDGSILDVYGGEYEFNRWTVRLWNQRGQDNGVTIRYGKNLTNLEQDENISNVATGIYPYWADSEGTVVDLPEKIVNAPGTYNFTRIIPVDFSGDFEEAPSEQDLRTRAEKYVSDNRIGVPTVSISVEFQPLDQTEEYKDMALLERVNLCDTVTVEYPELGVSATAKCVKTVYDALKDRYVSIELGDAKTNIADTISQQQMEIEKVPTLSFMQQAIQNSTNIITGNKGGYVVIRDSNGDGEPDEILIMDTPDIKTALKVWRWNNGGLGYSSNGYNGPYTTAITQDGAIVADFITTGTLQANLIKSGIIQSHDGRAYFNLDTGQIAATQMIAQSNAYGQFSAYIGQAALPSGGTMSGFVTTLNGNPIVNFTGSDSTSQLNLYNAQTKTSFVVALMGEVNEGTVSISVNGGSGIYLTRDGVQINSKNVSLLGDTLKFLNATITPADCYNGFFSAGDNRVYVKNGLITDVQRE
nr:MAG TPA: tail protein [Caudoviricetes sp.]